MRRPPRIPGPHVPLAGARRPGPRYPGIPRHLWGDAGLPDDPVPAGPRAEVAR